MSDKQRPDGFYHVKYCGHWIVADYCDSQFGRVWFLAGVYDPKNDQDFSEIGPSIQPPDEQPATDKAQCCEKGKPGCICFDCLNEQEGYSDYLSGLNPCDGYDPLQVQVNKMNKEWTELKKLIESLKKQEG